MRIGRLVAAAVTAAVLGTSAVAGPAFAGGGDYGEHHHHHHHHHHHPGYPPKFDQITASRTMVGKGGSITFCAWTFASDNAPVSYSVRAHGTTVLSGFAAPNTTTTWPGDFCVTLVMNTTGANKVTFSGPGANVQYLRLCIKVVVTGQGHHYGWGSDDQIQRTAYLTGSGNVTGAGSAPAGLAMAGIGLFALLLSGAVALVAGSRRRAARGAHSA